MLMIAKLDHGEGIIKPEDLKQLWHVETHRERARFRDYCNGCGDTCAS